MDKSTNHPYDELLAAYSAGSLHTWNIARAAGRSCNNLTMSAVN
jgi:hypothetical protein